MSTLALHAYFNRPERHSFTLAHDATSNITLRRMTTHDAKLIYQWQFVGEADEYNPDGDVNLDLISSNLQKCLEQEDFALFIAELDGHPIGHTSFAPGAVKGSYELGYYVEEGSRKQGYGKVLAKLTSDLIKNDYDQVAFVRRDNPGSLKIIEAIGFAEKQDEKLLRAQDGKYLYDEWTCFTRVKDEEDSANTNCHAANTARTGIVTQPAFA